MKYLLIVFLIYSASADIDLIWEIDLDYQLKDIQFDSNYEKALIATNWTSTFTVINLNLGDTIQLIDYPALSKISNFSEDDSKIALGNNKINILDLNSSTVSATYDPYLYSSKDKYNAYYDSWGFSKDTSFIYFSGYVRIDSDFHQGSENNEYNIITLYDYENSTIIDSLRFHIEHEIKEWDCEIKQVEFIPNTDLLFVYFTSREKEFNNVILWDYVQDSIVFEQQLDDDSKFKFILNQSGDKFYFGDGSLVSIWDYQNEDDIYDALYKGRYISDFSISHDGELIIGDRTSLETGDNKTYIMDFDTGDRIDSLNILGDYYFVGDDRFIAYHQGKLKLFEYTPPTSINHDNDYDQVFYPNPSSGEFNIELETNSLYKYSIYNIKGDEIESGTVNSFNTSKLKLFIEEAGVYFIRLDNGKSINTVKVIRE